MLGTTRKKKIFPLFKTGAKCLFSPSKKASIRYLKKRYSKHFAWAKTRFLPVFKFSSNANFIINEQTKSPNRQLTVGAFDKTHCLMSVFYLGKFGIKRIREFIKFRFAAQNFQVYR